MVLGEVLTEADFGVVRFSTPWTRSRHRSRSILLLDRRPRRQIEEQRENERQDCKTKRNGPLYTVGAGTVLAAIVFVLRLKKRLPRARDAVLSAWYS